MSGPRIVTLTVNPAVDMAAEAADEALRLAIAAGAAAVAGIGTARVQRAEVETLYRGFRPEIVEMPVRARLSGA